MERVTLNPRNRKQKRLINITLRNAIRWISVAGVFQVTSSWYSLTANIDRRAVFSLSQRIATTTAVNRPFNGLAGQTSVNLGSAR